MKKTLAVRFPAILLAALLPMLLLSGCTGASDKMIERTSFLYDTIITIKLRSDNGADALLSGAFELCGKYHLLFDRFNPESDIGRINAAGGQPCEVSAETAELIALGLDYSRLSGGRYDITCGGVTGLWDFSAEKPVLPEPAQLAAALLTVGWENVVIDGCTVTVPEGTQLDPGGIAKGYIADRIADYLKQNGVDCAIINLGGNVRVVGDKNGRPFLVGVQSPFEQKGIVGQLEISDHAVVTAGSYQRCFEADGSLYHHILDLSTGMPAQTGLASVTVISDNAAQADALATICFLMGAEEAIRLIEATEGVDAVLIEHNGTLRITSGAMAIFSMDN